MAQIFHPFTNALSRASLVLALVLLLAVLVFAFKLYRSPYLTWAGVLLEQPVAFSHQHHVGGLGIDCRYCHASVERSAFAGMPSTKTCMSCHSQVWSDSPALEPVRDSWRSGRALEWVRVHNLPDYAYFDHSIHVKRGVGCVSCHGRVDEMPWTFRAKSLQMGWCLDCHRNPSPALRPQPAVFQMGWKPTGSPEERQVREWFSRHHDALALTNCTVCHR